MTISTYVNVRFLSTITANVDQGLKYLILLLVFESVTYFCSLKQSVAKRVFLLDFVKHFQTRLNQRILSANWIKIKVSDQVEIRRKLEDASNSVQYLVEEFVGQLREICRFLTAVITILYLCPAAILLIGFVYTCFYRLHLSKQSAHLLEVKLKIIGKNDRWWTKYSRANANMFEYVIHHEKDRIINITNELKIGMERQWFLLDYMYDCLSFKEHMLGKLCTFVTIAIHCALSGANAFILPLYHYLSSLTYTIDTLIGTYIRWVRLKKDYDLVKPILEEYEERINAEQIDLGSALQIRDLSFHYQGTRGAFCLQCAGTLTFTIGQVVLLKGKSGAGSAACDSYFSSE